MMFRRLSTRHLFSLRLSWGALLLAALAAGTAGAASLEESLRSFEGRFAWDAGRQDYIFSDRPGLAALIDPVTDDTLAALVACIDDPRPAAATLDGAPVSLGALCYQALRQSAYVEAENWPGYIGPLADPEARATAKRAWQAALAEGRAVPH
ncbi:MAG: hypothetical protein Kow00114_05040 [Kiloniellaceae bacterium]